MMPQMNRDRLNYRLWRSLVHAACVLLAQLRYRMAVLRRRLPPRGACIAITCTQGRATQEVPGGVLAAHGRALSPASDEPCRLPLARPYSALLGSIGRARRGCDERLRWEDNRGLGVVPTGQRR